MSNEITTTKSTSPAPAAVKPGQPSMAATTGAVKKGAARQEVQIITRLNDRNAADSLYNVILQLTGGDKLFVDKFVMCCKAQIEKHWKFNPTTKKWENPFLLIPVNSQLDALYKCASKKILPDGYNCNLVPYIGRDEKKVEVSIDFKGLIDCAVRDKIILDADAMEVCENDDFEWSLGEVTRWTFDPRKRRGEVCGFCAWAVMPDGRKKWKYMSNEEIADVRKCARTQKIWDKWAGEMSKKTVIRRLFKTLRNTPALVNLMELDNETFDMEQGADGAYALRHAAPHRSSPVRQITGQQAQLPAPEKTDAAEDAPEPTPAEEGQPDAGQPEVVQAEMEPVFA